MSDLVRLAWKDVRGRLRGDMTRDQFNAALGDLLDEQGFGRFRDGEVYEASVEPGGEWFVIRRLPQ